MTGDTKLPEGAGPLVVAPLLNSATPLGRALLLLEAIAAEQDAQYLERGTIGTRWVASKVRALCKDVRDHCVATNYVRKDEATGEWKVEQSVRTLEEMTKLAGM